MRKMLLAAALTLTACDSEPPKTVDEINQIIRLPDTAMSVAEKIGTGAPVADVDAAMSQMKIAFEAAEKQINEITRRVRTAKYQGRGSIDPHDVWGCIVTSLGGERFVFAGPDLETALWLNSTSMCAINAKTYLESASGEDAAAFALAVSVLYPIVLTGYAKAGLPVPAALENYRSANQAIITKLASRCGERNSAGTAQVRYECAAHQVAMSVQPKLEALAAKLPTSP
jgi:hypothetical protein